MNLSPPQPREFEDFSELAAWISERPARVIAVDGMDGAGKTFLSCRLADKLKGFHLPVDRFVSDIAGYVNSIKYERLNSAFSAMNHRPVIFDSLLVMDVLERMHLIADTHIYIKVVNPPGKGIIWPDDDMHDPAVKLTGSGVLDLQRKPYNLRWRPAMQADALFLRQED